MMQSDRAQPVLGVTRWKSVDRNSGLMSVTNSSLEFSLQRLRQLRQILLRLHKALLDSEREVYEQVYGRIPSSGEFFRLVVGHEWFNWLRPISQLIVQIDQALAAKEPMSMTQVEALLEEIRQLLQPSNQGTDLKQRYYHAIQRDPDIALMHAEMSDLLDLK
jgi:hypothetical protein